jgi:hypothetical protein
MRKMYRSTKNASTKRRYGSVANIFSKTLKNVSTVGIELTMVTYAYSSRENCTYVVMNSMYKMLSMREV